MKTIAKILPLDDGKRIIDFYSQSDLTHLPKLISFRNCTDSQIELEFEWIEGSVISAERIDEVFFELGRFHKAHWIGEQEIGFTTVCHGDFHRNNIIVSNSGLKFVDVTYLHEGWNYSDLDYIDFLGVYDKDKYPWMIKAGNCLEVYHEGAGINSNKENNDRVKLFISKFSLERNIENGRKNKFDTSFEETIVSRLKSRILIFES